MHAYIYTAYTYEYLNTYTYIQMYIYKYINIHEYMHINTLGGQMEHMVVNPLVPDRSCRRQLRSVRTWGLICGAVLKRCTLSMWLANCFVPAGGTPSHQAYQERFWRAIREDEPAVTPFLQQRCWN